MGKVTIILESDQYDTTCLNQIAEDIFDEQQYINLQSDDVKVYIVPGNE
jgi:hypothetical protein